MQQKQLYILGGVLVLLLAVALLTGVFDRDISTVDVPEVELPAGEVEAIRIARAEAPLVLARDDEVWRLTEPLEAPADSATVARLLEQLGDLALESVVSTSPERYGTYGVDSAATTLTVTWPGGEGPDYESVFVRLDEDPRVFATRTRLDVPAGLDAWRDKTVVDLRPADVRAVTVERPEGSYEVRRTAGGWEVVQGGPDAVPADSAAVARWLGRFAPLRADGFAGDTTPAVVQDSTTHRIIFQTNTGDAPVLQLRERAEGVLVSRPGADAVFRLAAYRLGTYVPDLTTLTNTD